MMLSARVPKGALRVAACALGLTISGPAHAELISEYFNYGTSPPDIQSLCGKNGGSGWGGPWTEYCNGQAYRSQPPLSLSWSQTGYTNFGNDPNQGRSTRLSTRTSQRPFAQSLDGTVWVSYLVEYFSNGNGIDLGVGGNGINQTGFLTGIEAARAYLEYPNDGLGPMLGPNIPSGDRQLVLARLQLNVDAQGHDRVDLWISPAHLTLGEAGLGAPYATKEGFDAVPAWDTFIFGTQPGNELDAFRISYGPISTDMKLREVLRGVPANEDIVPAGPSRCGTVFGGASQAGGAEVCFSDTAGGVLRADKILVPVSDLAMLNEVLVDPGTINFGIPTDPALFLDLSYDAAYTGPVTLVVGYDDAAFVPFFSEQNLRLFHFVDGSWEDLAGVVDTQSNTITATTTRLSPFAVGAPLPAGVVPDGGVVPGPPLEVTQAAAGQVTLSWGASCRSTDADYVVYEGDLAGFYSHAPVLCSTNGLTTATFSAAPGDRYFLVVPRTVGPLAREGSLGIDSSGALRPQGIARCFPQQVALCP